MTGPAGSESIVAPFVNVAGAQEVLLRLLAAGEYDAAIAAVMTLVDRLRVQPTLRGNSIFLPEMDAVVQAIGHVLSEGMTLDFVPGDQTVVVATEVHAQGGHTRVIADLARLHQARTTVVLTDAFDSYVQGGRVPLGQFGQNVAVVTLPAGPPSAKIRNLMALLVSLRPARVLLLAHHHDAVAYAAVNERLLCEKWYCHHCDFEPALGATTPHYRHFDFARQHHRACASVLGRPTEYLPLVAPDLGVKAFRYPIDAVRTVTAGRIAKFSFDGPLAYPKLVAALLADGGVAEHVHIGGLPAQAIASIRSEISAVGCEPDRLRYLGDVPSLWGALLDLDAHVFLTSAPVGGLRTSLEAMGCGLPVAYYAGTGQPFICTDSFHPAAFHAWHDARSLCQAVRATVESHAQLSAQARQYYLTEHREEVLASALAAFTTAESA